MLLLPKEEIMSKEKLSLNNEIRKCYSVKEIDFKTFFSKLITMCLATSNDDSIIELRLDYLINKKVDIADIVDGVNVVKKLTKSNGVEKQLIATVRNFSNGGNCLINDKQYLEIVETLYEDSKVDAIDIDYDFYKTNATSIKRIFAGQKTLIITYTCFDRAMSMDEYREILKTLCKTPAYVIKVVTHAFSFNDTENLMNVAKECSDDLAKNNKQVVPISLGKLGVVSRVWHEYTNSKILYLDYEDNDMIPDGDINDELYNKYREILLKQEGFLKLDLKSAL